MAGTPGPWAGRITTKANVRDGHVMVGETLVPRRVTMTFLGDNGFPDLTAVFEVRDGRPDCVEVRVTAKPDGRGVTAADLSVLSPDGMARGALMQHATRRVERTPDGGTKAAFGSVSERDAWAMLGDLTEAQAVRRTGRITRSELEEVAQVYRDHLDGHPAEAVHRILGYGSQRTAARRIKAAEDAGLLPRTTPGKRRAGKDS